MDDCKYVTRLSQSHSLGFLVLLKKKSRVNFECFTDCTIRNAIGMAVVLSCKNQNSSYRGEFHKILIKGNKILHDLERDLSYPSKSD